MSPRENAPQKRRACVICTRAKAKCCASDATPDTCQRCLRLNKFCVFEESASAKSGPKPRSRVRQLEQRVESLIHLLSANPGNTNIGPVAAASIPGSNAIQHQLRETNTPPETQERADSAPMNSSVEHEAVSRTYDPVAEGLMDEQQADRLLDEFKVVFTQAFPFVLITKDAATLRHSEPFLFLVIMAVTSYRAPHVQCALADEMRRQLALIIMHSKRGLGILQGLLVYGAWYTSFYDPATQQLAIIVQLCVAFVQDLGLSRKSNPVQIEDRSAGQRALLGAYFLNITFMQAWRKRCTIPHTQYMKTCYESFTSSMVSTDALIAPMMQLAELCSRVNDHFSYDDIENSEITGEKILEFSTTSFHKELDLIQEFTARSLRLKENTTLQLMSCLVGIWIDECCLHVSLWRTPISTSVDSPSLLRLKMFHRTLEGATSYLQRLLQTSREALFHLGLQSWASWFHVVVVICKLVFLEDNERSGDTNIEDLPQELVILFSKQKNEVARQYNVRELFERFAEMLRFTLPLDCAPWSIPREKRDSLHSIACIHYLILFGFEKRVMPLPPAITAEKASSERPQPTSQEIITMVAPSSPNRREGTRLPHTSIGVQHHATRGFTPFVNLMDFDLKYDGTTPNTTVTQAQSDINYSMWDTVMFDFAMPPL